MSLILIFLNLLIGHATPVVAHEFHVSKCQIEYADSESSLQISMHIFIDDLEEALRQRGKDQLFLCTEKESEQAEQYLEEYLSDRFSILVNKQKRELEFVGKEISDDLAAVWCYLEIRDVNELKSLKISHKLLLEVFDDQKNVVSVKGPSNKKGFFLFQNGDTSGEVDF